MLFPLLLLAGHCADPAFCPSTKEIAAAVAEWRDERMEEWASAERQSKPEAWISVHAIIVTRVSDIYCDVPYSDQSSIDCKLTLHYGADRKFMIVRLVRDNAVWTVKDAMDVYRRARRR